MGMIKFTTLRDDQINRLLQNQGTTVLGNKAATILKLTEIYGSDEVDADELEESSEVAAMQKQIEDMRELIVGLAKSVNEIVAVQAKQTVRSSQSTSTLEEANGQSSHLNGVPDIQAARSVCASSERDGNCIPPTGLSQLVTTQCNWKKNAVHDIMALLPDFDPLKGTLTSDQFVGKIIQLQQAYGWCEQEILLAAQSKLKGVAKEWLDAQSVFQRWSEFESAIQRDFPFTMTTAAVHTEMSKRKRRASETMIQYYYVMLNIGRRFKVDEVIGQNIYLPLMSSVVVNGIQYSAFIDTGSDTSLITVSKDPPNSEKKVCVRKLEGFGGAAVNTKEEIDVDLLLYGCKIKANLQVVPDEFMPYNVFIGRDVLCHKDCTLVIQKGNMQVQKNNVVEYKIDDTLKEDELNELRNLLQRYDDCFAENLEKLGRCKTTHMELLVDTNKPIVGKQYQVPFIQRPVLSTIIDDLLNHDIIRRSSSPYAAPVVIVKKASGEDRMCVDFRALNAVTIKKQFPMPVVEEQLSKLGGNTFFTTLDMTAAYQQIPLHENSKKFTAFLTPEGLYE